MSNTNHLALSEVGKVLHKAKSGRLIIKIDENVSINHNTLLFNSSGKNIGWLNELIGPVKSPYASIILKDDKFNPISGNKIYKSNSKIQYHSNSKKIKRKSRDK